MNSACSVQLLGEVESDGMRRVVDSGKVPTCMGGESGFGKGSKKYIKKREWIEWGNQKWGTQLGT